MRLSGKGEDEARRTGAVDTADDQVEALFAPQYQTTNSPIHKAVWDRHVPLELFAAATKREPSRCDTAIDRCVEIVRRNRLASTMLDDNGKICSQVIEELAEAGYWGMLVEEKYGGQSAPFARFSYLLRRVATVEPTVAGMASVHGCIGAVDPVRTFGSTEQKERFLPKLANGKSLSGFALTEPSAGSDLTALRTRAELCGDHYEVTGEKLFITNAIPGRTVGVVCLIDDKPAVLIVELPNAENERFQTVPYGLYALRHTYNNGLKFNRFPVPKENLLVPAIGDGLTVAYHGLNLGRVALCATASGIMRALLANMLPWADYRKTYGAKINTRELVRRRIARLAALIVGADAMVDWCSWLLDQGYRGELECVVAKIFGSEAQKEAAIELFMKTHGGRSFLKGHLFGDNVYDFLAPCIYEGEGEMLGMAFFKTIAKHHGTTFFQPIGEALQRANLRTLHPSNPVHVWKLRRELAAYGKWRIAQSFIGRDRQIVPGMNSMLSEHVDFALEMFRRHPREMSDTMRKHQLKLPDRQCRIAEMSQRVQDTVVMLVTALWANNQNNEVITSIADLLCEDLRRKFTGERPSDAYFRKIGRVAETILDGGFTTLSGVPQLELMMSYAD